MSIYVISNDLNIEKNLFKVGRTKDTNTEIVTKYQRYLSGARLLLWYRSNLTDYIEDEREILRMFDSNRNRTPNGFKNEWLSIPFEQLKMKMDEYFGQDGEIFEEEKKRERGGYKCIYCEKQFSRKAYMIKHLTICKKVEVSRLTTQIENIQEQYEKKLEEQREQHEKKLEEQREQYEKKLEEIEQQLEQQRKEYDHDQQLHVKDNEIRSLKEQLSEFKTQLFEIVKHPK